MPPPGPELAVPRDGVEGLVAEAPLPVAAPCMPRTEHLLPYLESIEASGWYSNFGPLVRRFEARLAERFRPGVEVVTVANGTLALALALNALDLPPGALCALPAWTFVATAHAVRMAGLTPWFVDADPVTGALTPSGLSEALPRAPGPVGAVIPVSVMGRPLDAEAWAAFRAGSGIPVILDAAAGFDSAVIAPVPVMVSLHATKSLGIGEGAFIATRDPAFASRLRGLTNFAFQGDRVSRERASNAKLSEYAAAVGLAALDHWPETRARYLEVALRLRDALQPDARIRLQDGWGRDWVSSTCLVQLPDGRADDVAETLSALGIETRRWWGEGCHRSPAFADCPVDRLVETDRLSAACLGIPFFSAMDGGQIARLADGLATALGRNVLTSGDPP